MRVVRPLHASVLPLLGEMFFEKVATRSALKSLVMRLLVAIILVEFFYNSAIILLAVANQYVAPNVALHKNVNNTRLLGSLRNDNLFTSRPKTVRPPKQRPHGPTTRPITQSTTDLMVSSFSDLTSELPTVNNSAEQDYMNSTSVPDATGEEELLCLLKLYTDIVVEDKVTQIGHIDVDNNRLIFLIPLIIIYWHHRHPHEVLPFGDLESLLQELGDEARVHRRVLNKMVLRIDQCYFDSPIEDQPGVIKATKRRQEEQVRAAQALRVLEGWLADGSSGVSQSSLSHDRFSPPTNQSNPSAANLYSSLSLRRSSAREIRQWFESFLSLNSSRHKDKNRTTTISPIQVETTTVTTSLDNNNNSQSVNIHATGELDNFKTDQNTHSEIPLENSNSEKNLSSLTQDSNTDKIINNSSLTTNGQSDKNQVVANISDGRLSEFSLLNTSQNNEFFDLVSSILMEMDTINNSTSIVL